MPFEGKAVQTPTDQNGDLNGHVRKTKNFISVNNYRKGSLE